MKHYRFKVVGNSNSFCGYLENVKGGPVIFGKSKAEVLSKKKEALAITFIVKELVNT